MQTFLRRTSRPLDRAAAAMTTLSLSRPRRHGWRRGVTMLEYVLLAAIAVILAWLLREQLTKLFQGLIDQVSSALSTGR